jgi:hypothetical protein
MPQCLDLQTILNNGVLNENQDGTVSVYMPNGSVLGPVTLTEQCCLALSDTYTWDSNAQACMWNGGASCSIETAFKITLNPNGNEAVLFATEPNKTCVLNIEFDYLFKIKCETLNNILLLTQNPNGPSPYADILAEIALVQSLIETQTVNCEVIANEISSVEYSIENTDYSVEYEVPSDIGGIVKSNKVKVTSTNTSSFTNTAFSAKDISDRDTKTIPAKTKPIDNTLKGTPAPLVSSQQTLGGPTTLTYCIVNPQGLAAWETILGSLNYQLFLNGDPDSYTGADVEALLAQNEANVNANPQQPQLIYACTTPFGTLTDLLNQLDELQIQQENCQTQLLALYTQLSDLQAQLGALLGSGCTSPVNFFETLDVSLNVDVVTSSGTTVSVYEDTTLFPQIGLGNLYNYLTATGSTLNTATGFYVCGGLDCEPMYINSTTPNTCLTVYNSLMDALYIESGLSGTSGYTEFLTTLPNESFASNWVHHSVTITDESVLTALTNQNITVSLNLNHSCGDICILLDNLKINKECSVINEQTLFVTESPGFELERIHDNKKSWLKSEAYQDRYFELADVDDTNPIRITHYDVNDERLIINSKEIDLDINIAGAILTDIWNYVQNNPCILTGETNCDPCVTCDYKQFQDDAYFEFQDDESYDFMDSPCEDVLNLTASTCCGDNLIDFNALLTEPLSGLTTIEDFEYYLTSELIDVKNRQTISAYATLRALYDRYVNSSWYCDNQSAAYNYLTMDQFANLLGDYWVDIIEQVIPSTTIWGSVKVYSNTIFDTPKFKYRGYSSLFCNNPFIGEHVVSPINGTQGFSADVETQMVTLTPSLTSSTVTVSTTSVCDVVWLAQMNSANEFIGSVRVTDSTFCEDVTDGPISECTLQVDVQVSGYSATAYLVGAATPVIYSWSNGQSGQTATFETYGDYTLTVTDANCCVVEVNVTIPPVLVACWYTLPDSQTFVDTGFRGFSTPVYVYNMPSMVVNGSEIITDTSPTYLLDSSNFDTVSTPAGLTYTNFVTFMNQAFAQIGATNYTAQLALNGQTAGENPNQGFYIIRPLDDTFTIQVSETNTGDYYFTENDMLGGGTYFDVDCDGITVENGVVVE